MKKGLRAKMKGYSMDVKYSNKAKKDELIKFKVDEGVTEFEVSAQQLINIIYDHYRREILAPLLLEGKTIRVIDAVHYIGFTPNEDIKAGTKITIPYRHAYPLEFAILEEAASIAKLEDPKRVIEITEEEYLKAKDSVTEKQREFFSLQHKNLIRSDYQKEFTDET